MDQSIENSRAQVRRDPRLSNCRSILETHNPPRPDHSDLQSTRVPSFSSPTRRLSNCRSILETHNPPRPDHSDLQSTCVPSFSSPTSVIEPCNTGLFHACHENSSPPKKKKDFKWRIRRKGVIANDDSNSNPKEFRQPPASSLFFPQLGSLDSSHSNDDPKEDLEENTLEYNQSLEKIDIDPNFGDVSLLDPRFMMNMPSGNQAFMRFESLHIFDEDDVYEVPFELEGDDDNGENTEWAEAVDEESLCGANMVSKFC